MAITASLLTDIQIEADVALLDQRTKIQFLPFVETLRAIKAEQTATIAPVTDFGRFSKKRTVDVWWADMCNIVATDSCTTDCTLTGAAVDTDVQELAVDKCYEAAFSIPETALKTNAAEFPKLVSQAVLRAEKAILEKYVAGIIGVIDANKECATLTGLPTTWTCTLGDVAVPAAEMASLDVINEMALLAMMNDFADPFILSGRNLYIQYMQAMQNAGNGEGVGDAARAALIRSYFDPKNIDTINAPDLKTYLLNRGTIATFEAATEGEPDGSIVTYNFGQQRWRQESRLFPGIFFDVFYTDACATGSVSHTWKFKLSAGIWVNPAGCASDNKGIISFVNTPA